MACSIQAVHLIVDERDIVIWTIPYGQLLKDL